MSEGNGERTHRLQAEERHDAILAVVNERGSVTVRELAEQLGVAAVTIRVDVRELARRGLLNRVHGGATRLPAGSVVGTPIPGMPPSLTSDLPTTRDRARTARGERTAYTIGVIVPHASYYYPTVVAGAREMAERLGARLILGVSQNDVAEERALVARMLDNRVDGLILSTRLDPQHSPETETWLRGIPVPVVLAERRTGRDSGEVEYVATDHEQGAYEAVRHLVDLGHRRIGLLQFATITAPRLRTGYDAAVRAFELPGPDDVFLEELADDSPAELEEKAELIVERVRAGALDALVIHHDVAALPLLGRLRQSGISVPGDLSVVSYDDELAALADPPLTAVAPPRAAVGSTAVEMLMDRLGDSGRPQQQVLLRPHLRVRETCAAVGASPEAQESAQPDEALATTGGA